MKHKVWRQLKKNQNPKEAKILGFMWFMKTKMDGTLEGMLAAHGCSQKYGEHYGSYSIHASVTNDDLHHVDIDVDC